MQCFCGLRRRGVPRLLLPARFGAARIKGMNTRGYSPSPVRPNPSLKRSANGRPPGPVCTQYIFASPGLASYRRRPLSSNVRRPYTYRTMTPRKLGATLGLLAAATACYFIISRLYEAARPASTSVRLLNTSSAELVVEDLKLADQSLSTSPLRLPGRINAEPSPEWESKSIPLSPGLPQELKAITGARGRAASCNLEARPQGVCVIRVTFGSSEAMACEYECKVSPAQQ